MKKIKIIALIPFAAFISLGFYANFRTLTPGETVKPVHLTAFNIKPNTDVSESKDLKNQLASLKGVTACAIAREGDLVAVTYHPDEITEASLINLINNEKKYEVTLKEFPVVSGGCPVHKVSASFNDFVSALDLRN
jgi:hypothetical protein